MGGKRTKIDDEFDQIARDSEKDMQSQSKFMDKYRKALTKAEQGSELASTNIATKKTSLTREITNEISRLKNNNPAPTEEIKLLNQTLDLLKSKSPQENEIKAIENKMGAKTSTLIKAVINVVSIAEIKGVTSNIGDDTLNSDKNKLQIKVANQLKAVAGKSTDNKHMDKYAVLAVALKALATPPKASREQLQAAIKQYPNYDKAFFSSKTERLVQAAILEAKPNNEVFKPKFQ